MANWAFTCQGGQQNETEHLVRRYLQKNLIKDRMEMCVGAC